MTGHQTIVCTCGLILSTCRCFVPNKPKVVSDEPCTHKRPTDPITAADTATYAVPAGDVEASGMIFRPGDTMVVSIPLADVAEERLVEMVLAIREALGDLVEVVVVDSDSMVVSKIIRRQSPSEGADQ